MQEILKFLEPDETAFDLLKRCGVGDSSGGYFLGKLPFFNVPLLDSVLQKLDCQQNQPQVIEIEGESQYGKSYLLMKLSHSIALSGGSVLYCDLDRRLNKTRFSQFFSSGGVEHEMNRINIVQPKNSKELLAWIHLIIGNEKKENYRLVVIDSLLSFYEFNLLTDPLAAGYFVSFPRILFELSLQYSFIIASSKPKVPFEISSKTWSQGVTCKIQLNHHPGYGIVKTKEEEIGEFTFHIDQ